MSLQSQTTDVDHEEILNRYLTELDVEIAIQSLSPELREIIYKEYVANMKQMERTALASNPEAKKNERNSGWP